MRRPPLLPSISSLLAVGIGWALAAPAAAFERPEVRRIFQYPLIEGTRPSAGRLSPDEQTVAYFWNSEGYSRPLNLYVVSASGGAPRRLTSFHSRWPETKKPSWPLPSPGVFIEFSPDSKRILFGYDGDLFVAAVDEARLERLTRTDAEEGEATWSPNGRTVLYASGGALYRMSYPGPGLFQITSPAEKVSHTTPQWSPDGGRILFVAEEGVNRHDLHVPSYLEEWVTGKTFKRGFVNTRVGVVSPDGGEPVWIDTGPEPIWWLNEVRWSNDGQRVLLDYVSRDYRTRTLSVTDSPPAPPGPVETREGWTPGTSPPEEKRERGVQARVLYTETDPKWIYDYDGFVTDTTSTAFSPDDSFVLFTSEKSGFNQVYVTPVAGGRPRRITRGPGAVDWAAWLDGGDRILSLRSGENPARRLLAVDLVRGGRSTPIETGSTYLTHPAVSKRARRVLYEGSELGVPFDYHVVDTAMGKSWPVTRTVPARYREAEFEVRLRNGRVFPRRGWVLPEIVSFPARDGRTLKGLLYRPSPMRVPAESESTASRSPVVVFVHGAGIQQNVVEGWTVYSPNFKFATVLADRGFVVFEVDYRGSSGYGRDFRTDVAGRLGGKDLEDELAGVEYLATLPYVDPDRVGIYGGSYGGFLTEMALFRAPGVFAAGAALRPVADWANYFRSNPGYCLQRLGDLEENPEAYRASSPINFSGGLSDPLLLLHGVLDSNVPFQDTVQLTDRLQRQGKEFELMIYPREDHGFTEPENWIDEYSRILDFFERHLKR